MMASLKLLLILYRHGRIECVWHIPALRISHWVRYPGGGAVKTCSRVNILKDVIVRHFYPTLRSHSSLATHCAVSYACQNLLSVSFPTQTAVLAATSRQHSFSFSSFQAQADSTCESSSHTATIGAIFHGCPSFRRR